MIKLYLNPGHHLLDPGAWHESNTENKLTIALTQTVANMLRREGIEFEYVPDDLDLRKTIDWINARADINDTAVSIHFNSNRNHNINGTEVYYSNSKERELAEIYARNVSGALDIRNRGARPDTQTWVGSLGWLRKLKCDSALIEICYLTNKVDMAKYDMTKAADGILKAIKEIIPRKDPDEAANLGREADLCRKQLSAYQKIVAILVQIISVLRNQ